VAASRFIDADGLRVHLLEAGDGPPLVLLHGWPEFSRTWRKNIPALASRFHVLAPDLRGFGDTDKTLPPGAAGLTPEILAADLAALLNAVGLERVGIVAHDVGAYAAQAFARLWPQRLFGLFFFNCPYPGIGRRWAGPDSVPEIWYQSFNALPWSAELVGSSREACRLYIGHFLRHWAADPRAFDEDLETWIDNFMKPGNLAGGFAWYAGVQPARLALIRDGAPAMAKIAAPTRVLWGERDPVLRVEWADRLPDYFADVTVSTAPGCGHFVHYENPELANAAVVEFFAGLVAAG
jgi:pimeloyl-ACP methyl ester carboxylesterase